jgi:hypothetical protein
VLPSTDSFVRSSPRTRPVGVDWRNQVPFLRLAIIRVTVFMFLYFGYGSNMLTARLKALCQSAKPVCVAFAEGYLLTFAKSSVEGSGKRALGKSA